MSDGGLKVEQPMESMEALSREAEELKTKLEEERQKLNDVPRKYFWSESYRIIVRCNIVKYINNDLLDID